MDFQEFLEFVPKLTEVVLPAEEAHFKMAPLERIVYLKKTNIEAKNPRIAAVMMLLYPKDGITHLVLIVRNSYKGIHSAQIAFPGGKYETEDGTFDTTALRETHEEIGVHPNAIEVIKTFTPLYIPPSNFMVHPFLGVAKESLSLIPDIHEVADIIELPLSIFLSDEIVINEKITTSYAKDILVPAFKIDGHIVWGATAMMLNELKEVLKKVL